ncbi:TPA: hypothetical protein ACH3X1_001164 [Trebouxia sp. C0004]
MHQQNFAAGQESLMATADYGATTFAQYTRDIVKDYEEETPKQPQTTLELQLCGPPDTTLVDYLKQQESSFGSTGDTWLCPCQSQVSFSDFMTINLTCSPDDPGQKLKIDNNSYYNAPAALQDAAAAKTDMDSSNAPEAALTGLLRAAYVAACLEDEESGMAMTGDTLGLTDEDTLIVWSTSEGSVSWQLTKGALDAASLELEGSTPEIAGDTSFMLAESAGCSSGLFNFGFKLTAE